MKHQPFAILSFVLALGILLGVYFEFDPDYLFSAGGFLILLITILSFVNRYQKVFTFLGLGIVCLLGMIRVQQTNQINLAQEQSTHKQLLELEIIDVYKPSTKYNKYKASILKAEDSSLIQQNLLFYSKKNEPVLHPKDMVLTYGKVSYIQPPQNPHQFNYKRYINLKGIYLQTFSDSLFKIKHPNHFSFQHEVSVFKQKIKSQLKENGYSDASRLFIAALALGDRTEFNQEIQNKLSAAGVMHLFAISGLHIGILFGLILQLFYPLLYLKNGRVLRISLALIFIWIFAAFVNFTPSVTRAAFMISFYYLAFLTQRPTHIFHTLFFTAFVLLLINPNQLFDVGFQLSYSAVFFIAWLYKPFRNLFSKYRLPRQNYLIDILCVTTVAQLGVLPVSIYYFNQFSALFVIGNLMMIPLAIFLVGFSFISVTLIYLNIDFNWFIKCINYAFDCVLWLIEYLASYDNFIFKNVSISLLQVFILLGMMVLIKPILVQFRWKKLIPVLGLILLFQITRIHKHHQFNTKKELIVFNQYKGSVIGIRSENQLTILQDVQDSIKTYQYIIQPYILNEKIDSVNYLGLNSDFENQYFIKKNNLIKFNQQSFYIVNHRIDSLPNVDFVIATKGKLQRNTLIPKKIKKVIADGSNYPSVVNHLKQQSGKIYSTTQDGAYVFIVDSKTQ